MTWNQDKVIDDMRDITQRIEDALRRKALDDAAEQVQRLRVLTRFLADEIFAERVEQWDDALTRAWDVETK